MEHDEEAIDCMARTIYELWRQNRDLNDYGGAGTWPGWDSLHHTLKNKWLTIAAKGHQAYHDQYEALARR
jgi:hypothetical protein